MPFSAYVQRVALQAGLTWRAPFRSWSVRTRRWEQLAFIAALMVLDVALVEIPRFGIFRRPYWSVKNSPWFLVIGIAGHGFAWDTVACLLVDLVLGAYVASPVPAYREAWRIANKN